MNLLDYYIEQKDKFNVKIIKNETLNLYTVSYLHGGVDFNNEKLRMAKGLTIDNKGNIITRGFEKFFNYKQLEDSGDYSKEFKDKYSQLDYGLKDKVTVEDKLDGTLILLSVYNNKFIASTTGTTQSDFTTSAVNYFNQLSNKDELKKELNGKTLLMEYISPHNRIVVKYDTDEYVILGLVENNTGKEYDYQKLFEIGNQFGLSVYERYIMTLQDMLYEKQTNNQIEGYIVRNKHNKRIKIKTDYWFKESKKFAIFHGNEITKKKVESVINSYISDDIDDLIAFENQHKMIGQQREGRVKLIVDKLDSYIKDAEKYYNQYRIGEIGKSTIAQLESPIKQMVFSRINKGKYIGDFMVSGIRDLIAQDLKDKGY